MADLDIQNPTATEVAPGPWRIGRNHKLQFCVLRDLPKGGTEYRTSASGKASSFKTWSGADRVHKALVKEAAAES